MPLYPFSAAKCRGEYPVNTCLFTSAPCRSKHLAQLKLFAFTAVTEEKYYIFNNSIIIIWFHRLKNCWEWISLNYQPSNRGVYISFVGLLTSAPFFSSILVHCRCPPSLRVARPSHPQMSSNSHQNLLSKSKVQWILCCRKKLT